MRTDFKQDIINAVRKSNCPFHQISSSACWNCLYSYPLMHTLEDDAIAIAIEGYGCSNDRIVVHRQNGDLCRRR